MKRFISALIVATLVAHGSTVFAVDKNNAQYVGGTVSVIEEKAEGRLDTVNETALVFTAAGNARVEIPYVSIEELEYGQKAGRRVGVAIMVSPLALFSKKRNHFLTISYKDAAGKSQAVVFELGKDIVRTTLAVIEARSGKDIQFQDDDARKSIGGGKGK
jgi:hypothetical protein